MIGISPELSEALTKRYSEGEIAKLFGPKTYQGELRVIYQRPNGDRSSPMPSSRHMQYAARGWLAIAVEDPAPPAPEPAPIEMSTDVQELARMDRPCVYERGADRVLVSARQHETLVRKGWTFVRAASEREVYLDSRNGRQPSKAEQAIAAALPGPPEGGKKTK